MWQDGMSVIKSLYGMDFTPDPAVVEARDKKVGELIKELGDKYQLSNYVERKDGSSKS
jgi:hypothetical protein